MMVQEQLWIHQVGILHAFLQAAAHLQDLQVGLVCHQVGLVCHQVGLVYHQVVSVRRRVVLCLHREVAVM
jgi:hypothetical protein